MAEINVTEVMKQIPDYFKPEKAKGASGVVQCMFTGDQASNWVITIKDQTCKVDEGTVANPDLTIKADGQEGVKVLTGQTDPMRAYMMGKIKVYGDLSLGLKLANFFS